MSERKRLVELLKKPIYPRNGQRFDFCVILGQNPAEVVADYLLDNGIIRHCGEWKEIPNGNNVFYCSECEKISLRYDYCPNCGADMRMKGKKND